MGVANAGAPRAQVPALADVNKNLPQTHRVNTGYAKDCALAGMAWGTGMQVDPSLGPTGYVPMTAE